MIAPVTNNAAHSPAAIWHDIECGGYTADYPLWRRLARARPGPVLEIGAGTGRVAMDLARHGHEVTALELDSALLEVLKHRAAALRRISDGGRLELGTAVADARDFHLGRSFDLVLVPMQAIQLLGGRSGRSRFLRCAVAHLNPGARLAAALTTRFDLYDARLGGGEAAPPPDVARLGGTVYRSLPVAVRRERDTMVLERRRETRPVGGELVVEEDRVRLDRLSPARLEHEGRAVGLTPAGRARIPPTDDHVGSVVVMLDA